MEEDQFLTWEAVVCDEQGLPLTARQETALESLLSFNDEEDDEFLYIDEIPRPSEPWHVILNKIVPYLLIEPFKTFDVHDEAKSDGWNRIMTALDEHGEGLSLPPGVESPGEVAPAEMRHKLWLQFCFNDLCGLGQEEDMTLKDPEEHYRIDWFIDHLRDCKESVAHFGLTLDSLLTRVVLPEKEQPIFLKMMQEKLGIGSAQEQSLTTWSQEKRFVVVGPTRSKKANECENSNLSGSYKATLHRNLSFLGEATWCRTD